MPLFTDSLVAENNLGINSLSSIRGLLSDSTSYMDSSSPYLMIVDSTARAFYLPNAETLNIGQLYYLANDTTRIIDMRSYDGTTLITLGARSRTVLALADNTSSAGRWLYESSASSTFASYSVFCYYGASAGVGRYLTIYPGTSSDEAPYIVVSPLAIVAMTLGASAISTGTIGIFITSDLVNPIATVSLNNESSKIIRDVFYQLSSGVSIAIMVTSGSILKPYLTLYLTGI